MVLIQEILTQFQSSAKLLSCNWGRKEDKELFKLTSLTYCSIQQVEIENLQKLVEKMQEETEELEKERGISQIEGVRERLLIMERVEGLSQLYLGGLEEVRNDVFNVKITSRDRLDEIESQWSEYKRHQENSSEDGPSSGSRQVSSIYTFLCSAVHVCTFAYKGISESLANY